MEEASGAQPELGMDGMAPARGRELSGTSAGRKGELSFDALAMVWLSDISAE